MKSFKKIVGSIIPQYFLCISQSGTVSTDEYTPLFYTPISYRIETAFFPSDEIEEILKKLWGK